MSTAGILELRFCSQWAFKLAPMSRVLLCVSWAFLLFSEVKKRFSSRVFRQKTPNLRRPNRFTTLCGYKRQLAAEPMGEKTTALLLLCRLTEHAAMAYKRH